MQDGGIKSVVVTASGTNYDPKTTVSFMGGGGSGASAIVTIDNNGQITAITLQNGGTGYTSAPQVTFTDPTGKGTGATAVATV